MPKKADPRWPRVKKFDTRFGEFWFSRNVMYALRNWANNQSPKLSYPDLMRKIVVHFMDANGIHVEDNQDVAETLHGG